MISRPVLKGYYPSMETSPSSSMSVIVIDDSFSLSGNINNESRLSLINEKYNQVLDSFDEKTQICVISLSINPIVALILGPSTISAIPPETLLG